MPIDSVELEDKKISQQVIQVFPNYVTFNTFIHLISSFLCNISLFVPLASFYKIN